MENRINFGDCGVDIEIVDANVDFNDAQVDIEIIDSVLGKMTVSDMAVEDPNRMDYVRNKQLYQKKLVAGANINIDEDTNTISSELNVDGIPQLISDDSENAIIQGTDGKLLVNESLWLRNGGSVPTRADLPTDVDSFVAFMIESENLVVFSYVTMVGDFRNLMWLPMSFFADLNLYVTKSLLNTELAKYVLNTRLQISNTANSVVLRDSTGSFNVSAGSGALSAINLGQLEAHNLSEEAHPFILDSIDSIRRDMSDKEHFRGYFPNTSDILNLPTPNSGDYAYNAETGTKWSYTDGWADTGVPVPDKSVPASNSLPLMNGVASAGVVEDYARGDHVHPTDTSRVPNTRKINGMDLSSDRTLDASNVGAAPTIHSSNDSSVYGGGDAVSFGHVKLSDEVNSTLGASNSVAATPVAVKAVYDGLQTEIQNRETAVSSAKSEAKTYTDSAIGGVRSDLSSATSAVRLSANWATIDSELVSNVTADAIGNTQLKLTFTPTATLLPGDTPATICSNADPSIIPSLGLRFGGIWDYSKIEQVGFCVFDSDGDLSINAVSTLFAGTEYTLLV